MKRAILLALLATGCADVQDSVFPRYQDKPIETVVIRWGPPEQKVAFGGGTVYTFKSTSMWQGTSGTCRAEVHVSESGKIIGMRSTGGRAPCDEMMMRLR